MRCVASLKLWVRLLGWACLLSVPVAVQANDFLKRLEAGQLDDSFTEKRRLTRPDMPLPLGRVQTFSRLSDGSQYAGEWASGVPQGIGELRTARGDRYVGEFHQGRFDGQGEMHFRNGDHYIGQWKAGQRDGTGTMTYNTGQIYTGDWQQDRRHGKGDLLFPSGSRYEGHWQDDFRHGRGQIVHDSGERYVGDYSFNRPHGYGVQVLPNGDTYRGTFSRGRRHGIGECIPTTAASRTCLYDRGTEIVDEKLIAIARARHKDFYQTVERPFDGGIDFLIEDDFSRHPDYFRFSAAWWERAAAVMSNQLRVIGESENAFMMLYIDGYKGPGDYTLNTSQLRLTLDGLTLQLPQGEPMTVTVTEDERGRILGEFHIPRLIVAGTDTLYSLRQGRFRVFRPRR